MIIQNGDWVEVVYEDDKFTGRITHVPHNEGEMWEVLTKSGTATLINTNNPKFRCVRKINRVGSDE